MQPGESLWLPEDTAGVLAWFADRDARCGGCGKHRDESFSPDRDGTYVAKVYRCHACAARDRASHDFARDGDPAGAYTVIEEV